MHIFHANTLLNPKCSCDVNGDGLDDLIVGAGYADPSGKSGAGKFYVVFGNSNAINLSVIADASNPIGGFAKHNIRFTCI
jgi:hypothetical protein